MRVPNQSILKWALLIICLSAIGWAVNRRATFGYAIWMANSVETGRVKCLQVNLSPEAAAQCFGWKEGKTSERIFKLDCDLLNIAGSNVESLDGIASNNLDSFATPYFGVFDFNNDGYIPNPETLSTPPNSGAAPTLNQRVGIFSAGPDRDPATWEDNITSWKQ